MKRIPIVMAAALAAGATDAVAVDTGRVQEGRALAQGVCAECHVIASDDLSTVISAAPSLESIANSPGMTEIALSAALQTSHPTMPDLVLGPEDRAAVIAFILSLRRP